MTHGLCNIKKIHGKGNHLILDGYVKEAKFLKKKIIIKNLLNNLVKETKMTKISRPLIVNYKAKNNDKTQDGITGTIILAESNITIHAYTHNITIHG